MRRKPALLGRARNGPGKATLRGPTRAAGATGPLNCGTLLLITEDARLYQTVRSLANESGRMAIRAGANSGTAAVIEVLRPEVIVLDLDLDGETAWKTGEAVLDRKDCPPLILLTGRSEPFDIRTAIRAGSIVEKTAGAWRLLEAVDSVLGLSVPEQVKRNALQRVLIRWLKPRGWVPPLTPETRLWTQGD